MTTYYPGKSQYASALKVYNQAKNRSPDFLACDTSRVYLEPSADVEGEDYINASWIGGEESIFVMMSTQISPKLLPDCESGSII